MAKAALIDAVLDAELRAAGRSLAAHLGADTRPGRVRRLGRHRADRRTSSSSRSAATSPTGYRRIKLKIEPGTRRRARRRRPRGAPRHRRSPSTRTPRTRSTDVGVVPRAGRARPADDRAAAAPRRPRRARRAAGGRSAPTSAWTSRSGRPRDAAAAIELGACRIINIKQGRVGGVLEARRVHDVARAAGVPVWCGGMLETGIGRAANLALAAMPGLHAARATPAPRARYFAEDLTEPFVMAPDGTMAVPTGPGIGVSRGPSGFEAAPARRDAVRRSARPVRDIRALLEPEPSQATIGLRRESAAASTIMKKRVIRAEEFEVVDARGNVRLRIGLSNDDSPFFSMLDPDGQVRARFGLSADGSAGLAIGDEQREGPRDARALLRRLGEPGVRRQERSDPCEVRSGAGGVAHARHAGARRRPPSGVQPGRAGFADDGSLRQAREGPRAPRPGCRRDPGAPPARPGRRAPSGRGPGRGREPVHPVHGRTKAPTWTMR